MADLARRTDWWPAALVAQLPSATLPGSVVALVWWDRGS